MSHKIDLHTHSDASPDGGLRLEDYRLALQSGLLDYVAITDHNRIDGAQTLQAGLGEFAERIIIGEEIMTTDGEIIGLYLTDNIPSGLTPAETASRICAQGGIVYIPHPFEIMRSGISAPGLETIVGQVDVIETFNGRAFLQDKGRRAKILAAAHNIGQAASSDAHGRAGWGRTYSIVHDVPTRQNLVRQLLSAEYAEGFVGSGIVYPKLNRIAKRLASRRV